MIGSPTGKFIIVKDHDGSKAEAFIVLDNGQFQIESTGEVVRSKSWVTRIINTWFPSDKGFYVEELDKSKQETE